MSEKNYPDLINKGPDPDLTLKLGTLLSRPATGSYTVRLKTAVTALVIVASLLSAPGSLSAMEATTQIAEDAVAVSVPNDPCIIGCAPYGVPWYLEAIGAYEAWEVTTGSDDVLIAVVDTGIDDQHPDLQGRVRRIPGCGLGQSGSFDTSHGTFIAGLIGAAANNSIATAGLDWNAQILDVRVMNGSNGSTSEIAAGIKCAAANGADIISLSFVQQGAHLSYLLADAISEAQRAGSLVVAAAGNDGHERQRFPAAAEGVLSVGALDQSLDIASFATRGNWIDLMAPGSGMISLGAGASNGVRVAQGSSFAAPLVAAGASLVKARFPYFEAAQISDQLMRTAQMHTDQVNGANYKILNIEQALKYPYRSHWQVTTTGQVVALGESQHFGDLAGEAPRRDIVAIAANLSGMGYWLGRSNGEVVAFGDAVDRGDLGDIALNKPIVDMAATPSGNGYWLVASDGGIFTFGDAQFHGSTGAMTLNKPISSVVQTQLGYDLVAEDGGVFNFSSPFLGSGAAEELNGRVIDAASRVGQW